MFESLAKEQPQKPENNWLSLVFNVLIPVLVLHKLSSKLGPLPALFLALSFPLAYGVYDFKRRNKVNPLSMLGLVNVSVTGGLAVLGLGGIWFSLKEAFFPFLIGCFVLASAFSPKPFIKAVFLNPQIMDLEKIQSHLQKNAKELEFSKHLRLSTIFLAASFYLSAILNFALSLRIFTELDPSLDETQKALTLNSQIATMTQWSFLVIMLPSFLCLIFILWHLMTGIRKMTGLKSDEFMKS